MYIDGARVHPEWDGWRHRVTEVGSPLLAHEGKAITRRPKGPVRDRSGQDGTFIAMSHWCRHSRRVIPRSATYVRPDLVQRLGVWRPASWSTDIYGEAQAIAAAFSQDPRVLYPQFYQDKEHGKVAQVVAQARTPQGVQFQLGHSSDPGTGFFSGLAEWVKLPKRSLLRRLLTGVW